MVVGAEADRPLAVGQDGGMNEDVPEVDEGFFVDGELGDEWYMERVRKGYSQNGAYKMPPFESLINQEAMWAIRSYIESLPKPED